MTTPCPADPWWRDLLIGLLGAVIWAGILQVHRWLSTPKPFRLGDSICAGRLVEGYRADRPVESLTPTPWQVFKGTLLARIRWGKRRRRP